MKMKLALFFVCVLTALCCAFGITACSKTPEDHTHSYSEQVTTEKYLANAATCSAKATYYYSCSCGEKGTATFEYGEKDLNKHVGGTEVKNAIDATCASGGYTGDTYCKGCGTKLSDGTVTPKTDHTYNQQVAAETYLASEATCTAKATYYYSCTCGAKGMETFEYGEALGHTYSLAWSKDEIYHWHAATCEHTAEVSDKENHNWDDGAVTKEATETVEGEKTYTCQTCGKTKVTSTGLKGHEHNYNLQVVTDTYLKSSATCVNKAVYYYSCTCGDVGTETFEHGEKNSTNHAGGTEIKNAKAATCTEEGYTGDTYCTACETKLESGTVIDKIAHTKETIPGTAATCTETGLTDGVKCSVCQAILTEQTTIAALGHNTTTHEAKIATCTAIGLEAYETCSRCDYTT